jgi:hypothetical protein
MKYKYRYVRKNGHYIPQISKDGIKWVGLKEENLNNFLQKMFAFIATYERSSLLFTDTKEIYFNNEVSVNAFLGGLKTSLDEEITEFEHLN